MFILLAIIYAYRVGFEKAHDIFSTLKHLVAVFFARIVACDLFNSLELVDQQVFVGVSEPLIEGKQVQSLKRKQMKRQTKEN